MTTINATDLMPGDEIWFDERAVTVTSQPVRMPEIDLVEFDFCSAEGHVYTAAVNTGSHFAETGAAVVAEALRAAGRPVTVVGPEEVISGRYTVVVEPDFCYVLVTEDDDYGRAHRLATLAHNVARSAADVIRADEELRRS